MKRVAGLAVALVLAGCAGDSADYATHADAVAAGVVSQGRLPAAAPASVALIRIERDAGRAAGYFHFSSADYAPMTARFAALGRLPDDPALGNWVKRKDLAGYESYTSTDAAGTWLLMCAQNKGRCYFRRTD